MLRLTCTLSSEAPSTQVPPCRVILREALCQLPPHLKHYSGGQMSLQPYTLRELYHCPGKDTALRMAEKSLQSMAAGGMYDHVGGGFHRYSVDEHWHVPHFEKVSRLLSFLGHGVLFKTYG